MSKEKPNIIISAVNIFEGGPLTILQECLREAANVLSNEYNVIALVHNKELLSDSKITYIEYPRSRQSYLFRVYYEYFAFRKLSKKYQPVMWLSLHDMTPNVCAEQQAVYCHNPSPFYKAQWSDWVYSPTVALFSLFYKYLYRINIHKNDFVIAQQEWLAKEFQAMYAIDKEKLIIAKPVREIARSINAQNKQSDDVYHFFYPAFPRVFKNFEIICEAVKILSSLTDKPFKVHLTLSGCENKYSHKVYKNYKDLHQINFLGLLDRDSVESYYQKADALIFPSKLETWGLPISEFVPYDKPMLLADLKYAYETATGAKQAAFFLPDNARELAQKMKKLIDGDNSFLNPVINNDAEFLTVFSWGDLFKKLLSK